MGKDGIHIDQNHGQLIINKGGKNSIVQNNYLQHQRNEWDVLERKLRQLIETLEKTDELNEDKKVEYLATLYGPQKMVEAGKCTKGILEHLNQKLNEMSGIIAAGGTLGGMISAVMQTVDTLLK
ncbi:MULTISPECIES: hypothetical protein [Thermoactinomyces]|jgi:uncharacterized circularly permuted ATP-grasp superfamily protein|uniref:Uncharacterized protein n=1 Tax=Thermoactinomyces daqus TaxID=1329516 RepID=A0A7W1XAE5_9BACL|nr:MULTISPECIES: hypothetical protein [Thermoactinomyces]MBA4543070.1 hypothetical protein [Thermoactinomyces daqus]MBH8598730.1 hypothetical protein [Thermoactinomyces sp. CICC 10523]MBH8605518.1 hypothetical protein [Thermoactinomyces sp. CICC 10522]MBH8608794.1 hypothetical protein [Thermoactinomyces sp. CICC 10521]